MVILHNNKTEIVDNIQDCLNLADKDNNRELIEATESLINIKYEEEEEQYTPLQDEVDDLKYDLQFSEIFLKSRNTCLREVLDITEELSNTIHNSKRLNRKVINDYLNEILILIRKEIHS